MLRRTFYVSSPTARKAHQILYILILTRVLSLSVQAASPFPSWTFQFPNYKMEWNEKPPIDIRMEQTIDNWADYDSVVVVVLKDPSSTKENTNATKDLEMGMFFEDLDTCNMGILSKWMEKSELTKGDHFISDHRAKKTTEQEWVEVSKVCKVDLNGTMRVQRLIIYRIKEDNPIYVAAKMGRDVGKKLAAQLSKCEPGERWAFLLPPPPCIEEEILSLKEDDTSLPKNRTSPLASDFISEMITTLVSDLYKDNRFRSSKYKSKKKSSAEMPEEEQAPLTLDVVWDQPVFSYGMEPPVSFVSKGREALKRGKQMASGIYLAKDIVNAPHNVLNSLSLAETAKRLASAYPRLHVNVLNSEDCERHSMGAYLGVARGSETPPQFIHIIYRPPGKSRIPLRKLGIVGKGLLFDSGGYNLKKGGMELMKFDCGGAAAVFGAAKAIAQLAPEGVEVHFVVAACENMVNERAMVPGDILIASNGKTIEVVNTDAEGRLTMADALVYVDSYLGCEEILELSTLTGNCAAALGNTMAGLWSNNYGLAQKVLKAADDTGDKVWLMPLEKEYKEMLKSKIADINNLGGKYAGATVAALFLQEFVSKDKPFAHVDMAGTVWSTKAGATGWGAKLITEWVCQNAQQVEEQIAKLPPEQNQATTSTDSTRKRGFFSFLRS